MRHTWTFGHSSALPEPQVSSVLNNMRILQEGRGDRDILGRRG